MKIERRFFGKTGEGNPAYLYTLVNNLDVEAKVTNYGGIVVSLVVPDREGKTGDIVLGYDALDKYLEDDSYFGCIVGRYANRIADGRFTLNGAEYSLSLNDGNNHLHGGIRGFNKVPWAAEEVKGKDYVGLKLTYLSRDGEEGYPGNLSVQVTYSLTDGNELRMDYLASTDRDTVVNLSNHSYFNLAGAGVGDVLGHILTINADRFTPVNENLIPTGELKSAKGTPLDFTRPTAIGARIDHEYEQLKFGGGYDHNYVLNNCDGLLALAARVYEPTTGRAMDVSTTELGIQLYTGNFLDGSKIGKRKIRYGRRCGFCLEAQHFPDSPNQPCFPSTVLKAGGIYKQTTIYRFDTKK